MTDKRDLGLKVTDAIRLNEFAQRLADEYTARPPIKDEEFFGRFWTNDDSPDGRDWMHRKNSKSVADITIAKAVREGILELWVRLADGEASVDHYSIPLFQARDAAAGAYIPYGHNEHALYGRPLWVKNADWQMFLGAVMRARYPDEFAQSADPKLADTASNLSAEGTLSPINSTSTQGAAKMEKQTNNPMQP